MNPASAQHAALRILLEDVEPLLQQAEAITTTLTQVRAGLDIELKTLGELARRTTDAQPALLEVSKKLAGSAARIETAVQTAAVASGSSSIADRKRETLWAACIVSALLSAALVAGVFWMHSRDLVEQARIGRALQMAWPSLDAATRAKVHGVLEKS